MAQRYQKLLEKQQILNTSVAQQQATQLEHLPEPIEAEDLMLYVAASHMDLVWATAPGTDTACT
jgi:hypothetical protein